MIGRSRNWLNRIDYEKKELKEFSKNEIAVMYGPISSGNKVLEDIDNQIIKRIDSVYNDTIAVEMEATGLSKVNQLYRNIQLLNIRGISDLINNKSQTDKKGCQQLAAENAAAFTAEFLASINFIAI